MFKEKFMDSTKKEQSWARKIDKDMLYSEIVIIEKRKKSTDPKEGLIYTCGMRS